MRSTLRPLQPAAYQSQVFILLVNERESGTVVRLRRLPGLEQCQSRCQLNETDLVNFPNGSEGSMTGVKAMAPDCFMYEVSSCAPPMDKCEFEHWKNHPSPTPREWTGSGNRITGARGRRSWRCASASARLRARGVHFPRGSRKRQLDYTIKRGYLCISY